MAGPSQRRRRRSQPRVAPGDGTDYITGLPLEFRAHIASFLPFRHVGQLSSLSRPWRRIHEHTPVVQVDLNDFLILLPKLMLCRNYGFVCILDDVAIAGLEAALRRRAKEPGCSNKVDTLQIKYSIHVPDMSHYADRIITLTDARDICVEISNCGRKCDLSVRDLDVIALPHLAPTIAGPGASNLENLRLQHVVIREWSRLPCLRSLTLDVVTLAAPFPPGAWWPKLEELCVSVPEIDEQLSRIDIRFPQLKVLELDDFTGPLMDVTVVAPELEELVVTSRVGDTDYGSFTLQAPRLRWLGWSNQFTRHMGIDVGRPASVTAGIIDFSWNGCFACRDIKDSRALMMRMLNGLLPELSPEQVADIVRPHISREKSTIHHDGELFPEEKLTCDVTSLMSSLQM